jgi:hypothetical protein
VIQGAGGSDTERVALSAPIRNVLYADLSAASPNLAGYAVCVAELPANGVLAQTGLSYWRVVVDGSMSRTSPQVDNVYEPMLNLRQLSVDGPRHDGRHALSPALLHARQATTVSIGSCCCRGSSSGILRGIAASRADFRHLFSTIFG